MLKGAPASDADSSFLDQRLAQPSDTRLTDPWAKSSNHVRRSQPTASSIRQPLPGLRTTLVLLVSAVVCGCASSLPSQVDRPVTAALEAPQSTPLGSLVQQLRPASVRPQTSAFTLLSGAQAAYGARLALVEGAQQTLDLQYYAIHADESTQRLLRGVVEAARRGVRVRVLLDDFHSTGANAQVMRLAFVPGIEMRMFNPLAGARSSVLGRAYTLLTDFQRRSSACTTSSSLPTTPWA